MKRADGLRAESLGLNFPGEMDSGFRLQFKGQEIRVVGYKTKKGKFGVMSRNMLVQHIISGKMDMKDIKTEALHMRLYPN